MHFELERLKSLNILDVANKLGLDVHSYRKKVRCVSIFHEDRNPSMNFIQKSNSWKCYSCGASGSVIDLVMEVNRLDFASACKWLYSAYRFGSQVKQVYLKKTSPFKINHINRPYQPAIKPNPEIYQWIIQNTQLSESAKDFLYKERKLSSDVVESLNIRSINDSVSFFNKAKTKWGTEALNKCGFEKMGAAWYRKPILFPYYNKDGNIIQIQARATEAKNNTERFANITGVETCIYNMQIVNSLKIGEDLFIFEGVTDCLAALSIGKKAVAIPGASSYKEEYTHMLKYYNIKLIPDNDSAGNSFVEYIKNSFMPFCVNVNVFNLPEDCKDFSDYYIKIMNE